MSPFPSRPASYQRAGPIALLAPLLREFGVSPGRVSDGLGIDLDTLDVESRISFSTALALLERGAELTGCDHFGLLLGSRYSWRAHGIIQDLACAAPTLRQAILDFVTWQLGYSSGAVVYLSRLGRDFAFGYGVYDRASPGSRHAYELSAAIGCDILRELTRGAVTPLEILFCHSAPRDVGPHRRILKAPIRFNEGQCCLVLSGRDIDRPLPAADTDARGAALARIQASLGPAMNVTSQRLRQVIRTLLLQEDASMEAAARALGLHVRSLRRRLAAEGLTFETVRDEVRYVQARELLGLTDLPLGDIAGALAFATQSSFCVAFRRWSGTTPGLWRTMTARPSSQGRRLPAA